MIEKKTLWAVTRDLEIVERVAIIEDGKVLMSKKPDSKDSEYGTGGSLLRYFDTEETAKEWTENEEKFIRDMIQKVKAFIERMDSRYGLRKKLGIEKKDYLGFYGEDNRNSYWKEYSEEQDYAKKLEVFIKSRMLNINGRMIPIDQVREIKWYAVEDAEEDDPYQWKAVLTTTNGDECSTRCAEEVRLIWATIGKCLSTWFVDNDIDYNKED
jgi:hypothetical protein